MKWKRKSVCTRKAPLTTITAAALTGYVSKSLAQAATGILTHSTLNNCSSSSKLYGFCQRTVIFDSYRFIPIRLRSALWLSQTKTFKCFVLKSLQCCFNYMLVSSSVLRMNLFSPRLNPLKDSVFSGICLYLAPSVISSTLMNVMKNVMKNIPRAWLQCSQLMRYVGFVQYAASS